MTPFLERFVNSVEATGLARRINRPVYKWRDRWLTPSGRWLVASGFGLGIFSLELEQRQAFLFWAMLFGVGLVSAIWTRFLRVKVTMRRHVPTRIVAGSDVTYVVDVENLSSRVAVNLFVREEDPPEGVVPEGAHDLGTWVEPIGPGRTARARLGARFDRRGLYRLPALRAERTCPMGFTRNGQSVLTESPVVVHPAERPIRSVEFSQARVYQPGGIPNAATTGESTEFVGLREYRPGDPIRHISWAAWARLGAPVVREFQGEYFRRVAVVLDTCVRAGRAELVNFEAAVTTTASLARYFEQHEYVVDLFAAGPDVFYLQAGNGLSVMDSVMDLLACVEPSQAPSFPRLDEPLCQVLNRLSGLVLVTTDWTDSAQVFHERLCPEVPELKVVVVRPDAPTRDPALDVEDPRMLSRVDPSRLDRDLETL